MKATVFEIKRFAVHDGDGIRTTVFFKGCPLRCLWCHNPEGLEFAPEIAHYAHKCIDCGECRRADFTPALCLGEATVLYGRETTVEELLPRLLEDREFYAQSGGGVTLSGGECLMQADFCAALLSALKAEGIHTAVDTSGFVSREALEKVIPYTDIFLYDIKAYDGGVHKKCTGVDNGKILENLRYLNSVGAKVEIRIPCVPAYDDTEMEKIAEFLNTLSCVTKMRVLPYHNYAASSTRRWHLKTHFPPVCRVMRKWKRPRIFSGK
jgi:pyruvate formate lyase activating enzyme